MGGGADEGLEERGLAIEGTGDEDGLCMREMGSFHAQDPCRGLREEGIRGVDEEQLTCR